ncbi:M48 family metalloprotease [Inquilinus sp. KBS0705]|nr:M48 family metalloprotease [Inquilinus sp. KBS0705]
MKALIYLLQVSACTGIFYSFYFLLLRRLTFFTLNRWYLLITLLLSFVIPTLSFTLNKDMPLPIMQPVMYIQQIQAVQPDAVVLKAGILNRPAFNWMYAITILYTFVAVASVTHLGLTLLSFARRLNSKKLMQIGNVKVLKCDAKLGNSSFMNVIFINDDALEPDEIKQIIAHEMLHVKLRHSADRLIARLIQIVMWFNPFAYLYMRSIEENHEFEVDRIAAGEDQKGVYAQLLFKLAVSGQSYLFHSFSRVPLKKRISMLFNQPTSNMKKIVYLLILPVVVISCLAFANLKTKASDKTATSIQNDKAQKSLTDTVLRDTVKTYRQKIKRTAAQQKDYNDFNTYVNSADSKYKNALAKRVNLQTLTYKVVGTVDTNSSVMHLSGYKLTQGGDTFILKYVNGQSKTLKGLFKNGDEIQLKSIGAMWLKDIPIIIQVGKLAYGGKVILEVTQTPPIPKEAFLYEVNKVRFADGLVTNVQKYANGKWKSAVVQVANGYQIKFNIKPTAPAFTGIKAGDQVRFRFVHEIKTGAKEYTLNDWVSISTDIKDYGIKNPDYFYKFYEKV